MHKTTPYLIHPSSYPGGTFYREIALLTMLKVRFYCMSHIVISIPDNLQLFLKPSSILLQLLVKYLCKVQTQVIEKHFFVLCILLAIRVFQHSYFCFL